MNENQQNRKTYLVFSFSFLLVMACAVFLASSFALMVAKVVAWLLIVTAFVLFIKEYGTQCSKQPPAVPNSWLFAVDGLIIMGFMVTGAWLTGLCFFLSSWLAFSKRDEQAMMASS